MSENISIQRLASQRTDEGNNRVTCRLVSVIRILARAYRLEREEKKHARCRNKEERTTSYSFTK